MRTETNIKGIYRPVIIKVHDEDAWLVQSESNLDTMYKVTLHSCECKAFEYRGGYCKHMDKVMGMLSNNVTTILSESEDKDLLAKLLEESIRILRANKLSREVRYREQDNPEMEFDP